MHLSLLRPFASLSLAGFALSAVVSAQPAAMTRAVSDREPAVLSRLADDWRVGVNVPGLSAAVVQGDQVVWAQGFGAADIEQGVMVRPESVFRIASISKPITAVAVMQLVERGLVSLEDPIQKYVPAYPRKPQGEIRLRHLLTHTSGIRMPDFSAYLRTVSTSQRSVGLAGFSSTCTPRERLTDHLEIASEMKEPPKPITAAKISSEVRLRPFSFR